MRPAVHAQATASTMSSAAAFALRHIPDHVGNRETLDGEQRAALHKPIPRLLAGEQPSAQEFGECDLGMRLEDSRVVRYPVHIGNLHCECEALTG